MTLTNQISIVTHNGNGLTTSWPYTFIIPDDASARVGVFDIASSVLTLLSDVDYSITGIGDSNGGEVEYPLVGAPIASTKRLVIWREVDYTQDTDLTNQTPYYPEVLETQLDRIVMQIQQLAEESSRSVKTVQGSGTDPEVLIDDLLTARDEAVTAAAEAVAAAAGAGVTDGNKGDLTVSALGTLWALNNGVVDDLTVDSTSKLYNRIQDLPSVKDFGAKGDGKYLIDAAITAADATLTSNTAQFTAADVGKRVTVKGAGAAGVELTTTIASYNSATSVELAAVASTTVAGAVAIFGTDDTVALQAALDANRVSFLPNGTYIVTKTLYIDPLFNRGNGFVGLGGPSIYPFTRQSGTAVIWTGTQEPVLLWDGPDVADLTATSTTAVNTTGTGNKAWTVAAGKAFTAGQRIVVRRTSDLNGTYAYGTVTSYNSGTGALLINVAGSANPGSYSDWTITVPTACLAISSDVPMTIEPSNAFANTPYGTVMQNITFHGNDKAMYGLYGVRVQDGNFQDLLALNCKEDGIYLNGMYSGTYRRLRARQNWNRGVSLGMGDIDFNWPNQGALNRVTFIDIWGYANGRSGKFNDAGTNLQRSQGCGIAFGPHRGCALIGWTGELNDGRGLFFAPTSTSNLVLNGYTELNCSNDITGSGSAIATGRATEQWGISVFGAAGGGSWGNIIDTAILASEKIRFEGSEPSTSRQGILLRGLNAAGVSAGWANYWIGDGCSLELYSVLAGQKAASGGTFTPTLVGNTVAGTGWGLTAAFGYRRTCGIAVVTGRIEVTALGAGASGQVKISLPAAPKAGNNYLAPFKIKATNLVTNVVLIEGVVSAGSAEALLYKKTAAAATDTALLITDIQVGTVMDFEIIYITD